MPRRAVDNPLAEPVLALLLEQSSHPYRLAEQLGRGVSRATVYDLVRALTAVGWVAASGVERDGARPERTVYRLTDEGRAELARRLEEQVRRPRREAPSFQVAVSHLGVLGRRVAGDALEERAHHLRKRIEADVEALRQATDDEGVPRLFVIEADYALHMARAELAWVEQVQAEILDGRLAWPRRSRRRTR